MASISVRRPASTSCSMLARLAPVAVATATTLGVNPMPFVVAVTMAASAGFATPIGYQTHMMVYGPGGYKFGDFLKIGIPMNLLVMTVTMIVVPQVWPF